ncbi:hypothetical protein DXG01_016055 [Tephrocybe rancida]|nr:hypothetical protein DXG01_016055 [Tephrocybe rancida]
MAQLDWHFAQSCARVDDDFGVAGEETPDIPDDEQIEFDDPELLSPTYQLPNAFPSSHPDIDQPQPRTDALNNKYVRIIHLNGVHHIPVLRCGCHGDASIAADLVAGGLIPTSFKCFRTFFTMSVLDDFRLANLECKSSAYQYWNKLSRGGSLGTTHQGLDNFYRELRRLSRSWHWVKKLIWSGFAHDSQCDVENPSPKELALFCCACPQDKLNLPEKWKDPNKDLYMWSVVADGNFKADHVRQHPPGRNKKGSATSQSLPNSSSPLPEHASDTLGSQSPDKWLGEGGQFMTALPPYTKYVNEKKNSKPTKAPCENQFRYIVYLEERLSPDLPQHITMDQAIGLMHIHGHKDDCYHRFASSFIPGAAITAGEILETLWASLNRVSSQARTATLAHRAEILDDHMSDNNWKKIKNMRISHIFVPEISGSPGDDKSWAVRKGDNQNIDNNKINIQDKARQLARTPREEDRKTVIAGQERLASQITILSTLQGDAGYVMSDLERPLGEPDPTAFDNIDGNEGEDSEIDKVDPGTAPKRKLLAFPSSSRPLVSPLRHLEILLRVEQADRYLQNLRAVIAKKSFLYMHVIHAKAIKAVMTRARGVIAKLNFKITAICQGYSRCRAALVAVQRSLHLGLPTMSFKSTAS